MRAAHGRYADLSVQLIEGQGKTILASQRRAERQLAQRTGLEKQVETEHAEQQHKHCGYHDNDRPANINPHSQQNGRQRGKGP